MNPRTMLRPSTASVLTILVLPLCFASNADAKAAYAGKAEMVRRSEAIAVVDVLRVEKTEVKGTHWTYSQRAVTQVRTSLKGDLLTKDEEIDLFGGENFICARCEFQPGRYVVFLRRDGGLWTGSNWHLSVRPIVTDADGKEWVDWYTADDSIQLQATPLQDVLAEVKELIGKRDASTRR